MPSLINSDNGSVSGSAGLKSTADSSGVLALQTNGTTAVTIDTSQNVGVGTASPSARLTVSDTNAIPLRLGDVSSAPTSQTACYVGTATTGLSGAGNGDLVLIPRTSTTGSILFWTGNGTAAERMRILSTGNILSLAGGSTTATGTGITFPATQSASSDVNTLDDYEEGTWTPTVTASSGAITTYTSDGQYRKVGGLVSLQFRYNITNNGTGSGVILISNLPFVNTIGANTSAGIMKEIAVIGYSGVAYFNAINSLYCSTYVSGYPGGASHYWLCSICYYA